MIKTHWSVRFNTFSDGRKRAIWELEERINFGIGKEKISKDALLAHWKEIDIDPWKRKALSLALESE